MYFELFFHSLGKWTTRYSEKLEFHDDEVEKIHWESCFVWNIWKIAVLESRKCSLFFQPQKATHNSVHYGYTSYEIYMPSRSYRVVFEPSLYLIYSLSFKLSKIYYYIIMVQNFNKEKKKKIIFMLFWNTSKWNNQI